MDRKRMLARIRIGRQDIEELERTFTTRQPSSQPTNAPKLAAVALRGGQGVLADSLSGLQRQVGNRLLQRLAKEEAFVVSSRIERTLAAEQGRGEPLDTQVRRPMEAALGADLGQVRIHTDETADELASGLAARAFTEGRDVYFASGEYTPHTDAGQRVLAHELAHVLQQRSGAKLVVGSAHDPAEQEADALAERVVRSLGMARERDPDVVRRQASEEEEEEEAQTLRRQEEEELEIGLIRRVDDEEEEVTAQAPTAAPAPPTAAPEAPATEQAPAAGAEAPTATTERPTAEQEPTPEVETPTPAQPAAPSGPLGSLWNSAVVAPIRDAGEALGSSGRLSARAQRASNLIVRSRQAIDGLFEHYRDQPDTFGRLTYSRERMNTIVAGLMPYYSEREPVSGLSGMLGDLVPWLEGLSRRL